MTITHETITELRSMLAQLPHKPKQTMTARDAVAALAPEIQAARANGYGLADIAEMLKDRGLTLSASTLGSYLRDLRPTPAKTRSARSP